MQTLKEVSEKQFAFVNIRKTKTTPWELTGHSRQGISVHTYQDPRRNSYQAIYSYYTPKNQRCQQKPKNGILPLIKTRTDISI